ncbi:MAG: hypothetical protein JSS29_00625 [Proteobacteria bacterium]|nr:hypothetical protein [Pseudomonadota bacterium]
MRVNDGAIARRPARWTAAILIAIPLIEVLTVMHHPHVASADPGKLVPALTELAPLAALVHGVLIACLYATLVALGEFAAQVLPGSPAGRAGLLLYGSGVGVMTAAALLDGFVIPRLPLVPSGVPAAPAELTAQFAYFAALCIQAFTRAGAVLMCAGVAAWSWGLLQRGQGRVVAILGLSVIPLLAGALLTGLLHLNVHGITLVMAVAGLWQLSAGVWIARLRPVSPGAA